MKFTSHPVYSGIRHVLWYTWAILDTYLVPFDTMNHSLKKFRKTTHFSKSLMSFEKTLPNIFIVLKLKFNIN